jgi:trimeric autotransporter adhesin
VIDLNTGLYHSSQPSAMTEFNGKLYFWATGTTTGLGLWKTNGTAAGTQLVTTNPVAGSGLTVVDNKMYFAAINAAGGFDLCKSDGTTAGTTRVTQIITRAEFQERVYTLNIGMTNVRGTLYMAASNGTSGVELFKSDGTAAGTRLVADINAGAGSSDPASITEVNGRLFFTANDGQHGNELWTVPIGGAGQDDDDDLWRAKRRALPTELV